MITFNATKASLRISCSNGGLELYNKANSNEAVQKKESQHSSVNWPVWLNGWVFVYELGGCGFESCGSQDNSQIQ